MNIFFVGQTTISKTSSQGSRIHALAKQLAKRGHEVIAFTATGKELRRGAHMRVQYLPSLVPDAPGGWLYTLLSILSATRKQADVIQVTSWKAAALIPLAAVLRPHTTIIWTTDTAPSTKRLGRRLTVWLAARLCDAITTPTREAQYRFRNLFGVLPIYIPDGYNTPIMTDIPTSHWKLRKNTYTLALCDTPEALQKLCKAYKSAKSRKKVSVLTNALTPALKRIQTRNSFIRIIEANTPRARASLIRNAGSLVIADATPSTQEFLLAMESGVPLIAVNHPLYQEIAGTTVQFFQSEDAEHFSKLLGTALQTAGTKKKSTKTTKRARAHFMWERIYEDYEILYHYPLVRRVPVDSVRPNLHSPVPLG